jgi:hypothetical protein
LAGKWAELILSPIEKHVKLDYADPVARVNKRKHTNYADPNHDGSTI